MSGESQCQRPRRRQGRRRPGHRRPARPPGGAGAAGGFAVDGGVLGTRPDRRRLTGAQIEPVERPFLRLHVDDGRILGIVARLEAVAAADAVPVAGADAGPVQRPRRAADGPVVLRAAADVVERLRVVGRDPVELRQRQVGEVPPGLHAVVGLVESAVVAEEHVVTCRSDRTRSRGDRRERLASDTCDQVLPPSVLRSTLVCSDQIVSGSWAST